MAHQVNIHEAKTHLSRLIQDVGEGQEVVIAKANQPVARLVPYDRPVVPRKPGLWRGQVKIADDFDRLPADIEDAFAGQSN